jgi:hypothetical protein
MGTDPPMYVQVFPPDTGVAAVNVTPTIDEAWAAVRSEQTFGWPPAAAAFAELAGAVAAPAGALLAVPVPAVDFDPLEHAVADAAIRVRANATIGVVLRMASPRCLRQKPKR